MQMRVATNAEVREVVSWLAGHHFKQAWEMLPEDTRSAKMEQMKWPKDSGPPPKLYAEARNAFEAQATQLLSSQDFYHLNSERPPPRSPPLSPYLRDDAPLRCAHSQSGLTRTSTALSSSSSS